MAYCARPKRGVPKRCVCLQGIRSAKRGLLVALITLISFRFDGIFFDWIGFDLVLPD